MISLPVVNWNRMILFLAVIVLVFQVSCKSGKSGQNVNSTPPSHQIWDELLTENVSDKGAVSYKAFQEDSVRLKQYLAELEAHPPSIKWTRQEKMSYWINAYNAYTVKMVVDHYPVESIKDIGPAVAIVYVNTVWDIKFIEIGGESLDLNNIEHGKLRKKFKDPRIHFALVCASYSCPRLLNRAYVPEKLEAQLDDMAKDFLQDQRKNKISSERLELSKIFTWYKSDFKAKDTPDIQDFIQKYTTIQIIVDPEIVYLDYDWQLNERP